MEGHQVAVRILGVVPTSHGYAYALTEGPTRLLDWARCEVKGKSQLRIRLDELICNARPLFVTSEVARNGRRSDHGRAFNKALKAVCKKRQIMILCVERELVYLPRRGRRPVTDYEIGAAAAARFPVIANKLRQPRQLWEGPDNRIGILLAASCAIAGWNYFRPAP